MKVLWAPWRMAYVGGEAPPQGCIFCPAAETDRRAALLLLRDEYRPDGMNIGMNLGRSAGAGIAEHFHWHVLPRWNGDTNFMPVLGDVRVIPEHLQATYDRLYARRA